MSLKQVSVLISAANVDTIAIQAEKFKVARIMSISNAAANITGYTKDEDGDQGSFVSLYPSMRLKRDQLAPALNNLTIRSSAVPCTVVIAYGFVDDWIQDPTPLGASGMVQDVNDYQSGTGGVYAAPDYVGLVGGIISNTSTVLPISVNPNYINGSVGGNALQTSLPDGSTTATAAAGVGFTASNFDLGSGLVTIEFYNTSTVTALSSSIVVSGAVDGAGLVPLPVYDKNGYLISQVGKINLSNLSASGSTIFYVDGSALGSVQVVVPTYTTTAPMICNIQAAQHPGQVTLKQIPAMQYARIATTFATGTTTLLSIPAGTNVWLYGVDISLTTASTIRIYDATSGYQAVNHSYDTNQYASNYREQQPLIEATGTITVALGTGSIGSASLQYGLVNV